MIDNQIILYKFIQTNLNHISYCYNLSENFITEFQDKIEWYHIAEYQTLSEKFKKEFKHKLND